MNIRFILLVMYACIVLASARIAKASALISARIAKASAFVQTVSSRMETLE